MKKEQIPNAITIMRIILIPVFIILLQIPQSGPGLLIANPSPWNHTSVPIYTLTIIAAIVFAVASTTDFLDGHLARKWHVVSNFGKFADPLADKMLTMVAFIYLVFVGLAPAWVVAIIVCRELAVTGLRLLIVEQSGTVHAAAMPGKIKTATQMTGIIFLLIGNFFFIGTALLYICLFFTIYSGIDYFYQARWVFKNQS
ncbi:MAG: CDP-diacylglycerol--glycerol-3-phosphate 3-phosphatidyltransferase [Streptococcaceae bacterium]|jgi:CDP-diacylglycerol--glycerol-3-phosphate 3-phosphatidyltransferase|nr:CDP-diacylglycerol--glycerol-3-phosphate 3-phosphatidyltransferase [Streptococcaceae bacterium]